MIPKVDACKKFGSSFQPHFGSYKARKPDFGIHHRRSRCGRSGSAAVQEDGETEGRSTRRRSAEVGGRRVVRVGRNIMVIASGR